MRRAVRAAPPADVLDLDQGARRAGLRIRLSEALTNGGSAVTPAEAERTPPSARSEAAICPLPWGDDATPPPRRSGDLCPAHAHRGFCQRARPRPHARPGRELRPRGGRERDR